jgi:hypothetical protein
VGARKLTQRKSPRLGYSEYVSRDLHNSNQVWMARLELIEAVKRVHPKFLETLSAKVFPFYQQLARAGYDFDQILWSPAGSPNKALTDDGGLKRALSEWAAEFNVASEWLMDEALRTLQGWHESPERRESLSWTSFYSGSLAGGTGEPFEFAYVCWETEQQAWSQYRDLLRAEFERELSKYKKETRKLAMSLGLVPAHRKHSPENFDWFVLYQFAGLSSVEIAKKKYKGKHMSDADSTVLKGIKAVKKLVGWSHLRKPTVGRSRKIG